MRYRPFCGNLQLAVSRRSTPNKAAAITTHKNGHATLCSRSVSHFVFGANTDIGKTVLTAALIRASADPNGRDGTTHYIKPLQCGGSDEAFVRKYASNHLDSTTTLFRWETPASPHFAARIEDKPISDQEVVNALRSRLDELNASAKTTTTSSIWIETAGGVMSPSSSSPQNQALHHSRDGDSGWGWVTQADLYGAFKDQSSVVLIGDGRLGGISSTLTALEALLHRNYTVGGILLIRGDDCGDDGSSDPNLQALREYVWSYGKRMHSDGSLFANPEKSILSLPKLPPEPEPLDEWYASSNVRGPMISFVREHLFQSFHGDHT